MISEGTSEIARRPHRVIGLIAGPLACLALVLAPAPTGLPPVAWTTAAIGLWMAIWWMTEAVPLAATALLPVLLFPLLGVLTLDRIAASYADPLIFLFLGGFYVIDPDGTGLIFTTTLGQIVLSGVILCVFAAGRMAQKILSIEL